MLIGLFEDNAHLIICLVLKPIDRDQVQWTAWFYEVQLFRLVFEYPELQGVYLSRFVDSIKPNCLYCMQFDQFIAPDLNQRMNTSLISQEWISQLSWIEGLPTYS
jgi:hypothetical protein